MGGKASVNTTLRIVGTLIWNYLGDVLKSPSLLICCFMPVALMGMMKAIMISEVAEYAVEFSQFIIAASLSFVSAMVPSSAALFPMGEERGKKTLRTLLLARVSMNQMVVARGIAACLIVALTIVGCCITTGAPLEKFPLPTFLGLMGSLPLVFYSLAMGLIARDQMSASVLCLPAVILGVLPVLFWYSQALSVAIPLLPSGGVFALGILTLQENLLSADALFPCIATLVWIVITAALLVFMLKRTRHNA